MSGFDQVSFWGNGIHLEGAVCITCGCFFAVPAEFASNARKQGKFSIMLHCPNGHKQGWGESEADRVRRERDLLRQQIAQKDDMIKAGQRDYLEAREALEKVEREKRRIVKRISNGICTCCNRSFANLARHIKTQHPEQAKLKVA